MKDARVQHISRFSQGLADLKLSRHPLAQDIMFIENETSFDHYRDATKIESARIKKKAVFRKKPDLYYVQEQFEDYEGEGDVLPWMIIITATGLSRIPRHQDAVITEGKLYTLSRVKPVNQARPVIFECLVYPERSQIDPFGLYSVSIHNNFQRVIPVDGEKYSFDVIYGGTPVEMSFDNKIWVPFEPSFKDFYKEGNFYIKDKDNNIKSIKV